MRTIKPLLVVLTLVGISWAGFAQNSAGLSPAEKTIQSAQRAIAEDSSNVDAYNRLAIGLARRARETSDPLYYKKADEAIARSLELAPGNWKHRRAKYGFFSASTSFPKRWNWRKR
jgi:hypothetical protein